MEEPHTAFPAEGMKILYYSPHPTLKLHAPTGYGTHMREMIRAFEELDHEVKFFIGGETTSTQAHESVRSDVPRKSPMKTILKMITPKVIWETVKDLQLIRIDQQRRKSLDRICSEFEPDVIYERSHYGMVAGIRVANDRKIHHILEVNSPNVEERIKLSGKSLLTRRATQKDLWAFSQTDHVLTVSTHLAEFLKITNIAKKWSVTPNAIRLGQNEESSLENSRKTLQIDDSSVLLGFVGSAFPWHGIDLIIHTVAYLQQRGRHVQAMIVGDGAVLEELKFLTKQYQLENMIHFVGSVPQHDTFSYTQLCDILIMPKSNAYGSPVKIFEYGLAGKPCIVPNTFPVVEVFEHEQDGWVVDPNVNAIALAIETIIDTPEKAEKCANNWHHKVTSKHTWTTNAAIALDMSTHPIL